MPHPPENSPTRAQIKVLYLRLCAAAFASVTFLLQGAPAEPAETKPEEQFAYIRDATDPAHAVRRLVAAARERGAESIAFVLDRATFDPPPGESEFTAGGSLVPFREAWLEAAVAAASAPDALPTTLALSTSTVLRRATRDDASALVAECDGKIWDALGRATFVSAATWIETFAAALPGKRRAIVLVTGNVFPEGWIRPPFDHLHPQTREPWRRSLVPSGAYWQPEAIAVASRRRGVTLLIAAPETVFGDEAAIADLPEAPLVSRPRAELPRTAERKPTGEQLKPGPKERDEMKAELRRRGFDEADIGTALALKDRDAAEPTELSAAGRFSSTFPAFFPLWGTTLTQNTDCPSGFGWWPLARAAAATGGVFLLHPSAPSHWMDRCVRDETLLAALAPSLGDREAVAADAKGDLALIAMLKAQEIVLDVTPWTDYSQGFNTKSGGLAGWCGFELPGPVPARRWEPRCKPLDNAYYVGSAQATAVVAARAAESYTRAIRVLAAAQADPRFVRAPRRSQAHLRLCRYWFEMSLFHVQSLAFASRDPMRFGATDAKATKHALAIWRAVNLSDCLPAYDGRVLTDWDERRYGPKWKSSERENSPLQAAFLAISSGDPNFRAQRDTDRVLARLDERQRPQALATIAAARDVMEHEARTPWGWTVYYSTLHTYAWDPPDPTDRKEPRETPRSGPGSSSAGSTTPK